MKWYWIVAIILGALILGYIAAMIMPASNMGFMTRRRGSYPGYPWGNGRTVSIGGRGIGLYY